MAARQFRQVYGEPPAGVWAAPGRVNLIGEHTDYNDGYVLPFALPQRAYVAATPIGGPPRWAVYSAETKETVTFGPADLRPGRVPGWAGYVAGVVWAMRAARLEILGAQLAITSDIPLGAGLSSSAALECAVLTALADLWRAKVPVGSRPALAQRAEDRFVGMPCGIMDQSASILCEAGHALFLDCRSGQARSIPLQVARAGLRILVIDTRAPHQLVSGEYAARRATCERAAGLLGVRSLRDIPYHGLKTRLGELRSKVDRCRVRHVVTENQRVLDVVDILRSGELAKIGPLLSASHASLRDDYQVTVPELDLAVEAAEAAGAHGARMTGGGFGGCVIALVDADRADAVAAAVGDAFAAHGYTAPVTFPATPGPGATRIV